MPVTEGFEAVLDAVLGEMAPSREVPGRAAEALRHDPSLLFEASGLVADAWQKELLASEARQVHVCNSRQVGKSFVAAALSLVTSLTRPEQTVLIVSRSQRQSAEVLLKVKQFYNGLAAGRVRRRAWHPEPVKALEKRWQRCELTPEESATKSRTLSMEFGNGSRIVCLPCKPDTIVGYSDIDLLVLDEAARIPDELYVLVRPMLAASMGRLVALSTPYGKRGWFYDVHRRCEEDERLGRPLAWHRIRVPVTQCPRISREFLEEERLALGSRWYAQEYETQYVDLVGSVFAGDDVEAALSDQAQPLFS